MTVLPEEIRLTKYSHGAGCGCKISPKVLDEILSVSGFRHNPFPGLIVGNDTRDDAAVMDLGDGSAIISTTDFFMPIVDDPLTFGGIAAANAISDIYAMGGKPIMAIAILGWPINTLDPKIAGLVIEGAQQKCLEAGIPLAGGHSIDSPEPIFGLAVTGRVQLDNIKKNGGADPGDILFLTKFLGTGIISTAQKQQKASDLDMALSIGSMLQLNKVGEELGKIPGVHALTDVTGFGLGGHLIEMCKASNTSAELDFNQLPILVEYWEDYVAGGCVPGGTNRNLASYGEKIHFSNDKQKYIVCDPQTSGGLLIAVKPSQAEDVVRLLNSHDLYSTPVGKMAEKSEYVIYVQ